MIQLTRVPTAEHLPSVLIEYEQWVCWQTEERDGKETKIPINPNSGRYASTTDSSTWTTFEDARSYAVETPDVAGLGFVFTDEDPLVGVDLDNCRDEDGNSPTWAADIIDQLNSYTEISPSGTGYHIIVMGYLPTGPNRRGDIECYQTARYFTVTGESVHDPARPVGSRTVELAAIHAEHVVAKEGGEEEAPREAHQRASERPVSAAKNALDDDTVIEKARAASNGPKFERLWNGSTSGYDSQSEADMALCFLLAFWTGGDTAQMDRLFRRSGLMREKWDETHFSDGSTYGEKTIRRAAARVDEFYDPTERPDRTEGPETPPTPERKVVENAEPIPHEQSSDASRREQRLLGIVDQLEARVDELEAENEALREELRAEHEQRDDQQGTAEADPAEPTSLWARVTSRLGGRDE